MMFKNSFKLLLANFSNVWKTLLYKLIVLVVVCGLFYLAVPAISSLTQYNELMNSLLSFLTATNFNAGFANIILSMFAILQSLFAVLMQIVVTFPFLFVYLIFLFFAVLPFLWHLGDVAVGEVLYGYMSSQTKYGFVASIFKNAKKSVLYSLNTTVAALPFNAIIILGVIGLLYLSQLGTLMLYFLPVLIFVFLVITISLKTTCLAGFMPSTVCNEKDGIYLCFKKGVKAVSRRFYRTLSTSLILWSVFVAVLFLFGTFASIFVIAIGGTWLLIFQMVMYFGSQGMKFYVDMETIAAPKKLEQTDSIKKVKNII